MIFFVHVDIIFSLVVLARQGQKDGGMEKGGRPCECKRSNQKITNNHVFLYIYMRPVPALSINRSGAYESIGHL